MFEHYVEALLRRGKTEWGTVIRDARSLLELKKPSLPYKAVVVDEAQDFHAEEWRLMRAIVPTGPNDLFLVGDAHQRIYGHKIALRSCGVNIQGRSSRLRINYRTTEEIRAWAMAVLAGVEIDDLDGGREDEKGYKSLLTGPRPEARHFGTRPEELEYVGARIKELVGQRPAEHVCLVARTNKLLRDDYQPMLKGLGIESTLLDETPEGARGAAGDDAPGQGAGVPRDDPGRGQRQVHAAAGARPRGRPGGRGRPRGPGAVAPVRGGDPSP